MLKINSTIQGLELSFSKDVFEYFKLPMRLESLIFLISSTIAIAASASFYLKDRIIAYGDAESHLNIAKRVIDSLTPGFAQLGGIWLPLPHILLIPFVGSDFLWRSGLAGSIVSGAAFIISAVFIYRLVFLLTEKKGASFFASIVFMLNPNMLYMQSTPMTELPLIAFYILSMYYFIKFIKNDEKFIYLISSAFFGFCAALSRYDGWFLILMEASLLVLIYFPYEDLKKGLGELLVKRDWSKWYKLEGIVILFSTIAFFSIALWLAWDFLILGDPLYFTNSQFSAKSQQSGWLAKGELPAYHNPWLSFIYYFATSMSNVGNLIFIASILGFLVYLFKKPALNKLFISLLMLTPFLFYVITLYMGQSVIFIPSVTPTTFEWTLFNVRYGIMMVPFAAIFMGYVFYNFRYLGKAAVVMIFIIQSMFFGLGYDKIITLADGTEGLSHSKIKDAENFLQKEYDGGLVLIDDFSRSVSIIRSGIPMENIIYIGNKPYWEESFATPEKHARWIILQEHDEIWNRIYEPQHMRDRLFTHFNKVYESPEILIFRRQ